MHFIIIFLALIFFQSASALLAATMSAELHPEGFKISNRPIAASFANPGSFAPLAPHSLRDEGCVMGSVAMGGQEGTFAKYWDESSTVVEISFEGAQSVARKEAPAQAEKKKKKKAKDEDASRLLSSGGILPSDKCFKCSRWISMNSWLLLSSRRRKFPLICRRISNH